MEIDKEDFDRGMRLIGTSNEKIIDWLNSNNFELEDDAEQVFGIFEPHHFLDEELRDGQLPDVLLDKELIDELRYHQLLNGEEPNQQEINLCKVELVRSKRDDFPEGSIIFYGEIKCQNLSLYVFTKRFGDSFDGVTVHLLGIFDNLDKAKDGLFRDGIFIQDTVYQ